MLFVSCDIVGHSGERNLSVQQQRVEGINRLVRQLIEQHHEKIVWASGGDGGHVALEPRGLGSTALDLIARLHDWSVSSRTPLRIIAHMGPVERLRGADDRVQLVGDGINLAGRLLTAGGSGRVIVTAAFRESVLHSAAPNVRFHDRRELSLKHYGQQQVYLLSIDGLVDSRWNQLSETDDSALLDDALQRRAPYEVIYRAKRLLEVNPVDPRAASALRTLNRERGFGEGNIFFRELFVDDLVAEEFVRGCYLVERRTGDVLCRLGDSGHTMFIVLSGTVMGFLASNQRLGQQAPNFEMNPGDLLGELAAPLGRRRTATIQCATDSAFLAFSEKRLLSGLRDSPIRERLKQVLDRRVQARVVEHVWNTAPFFGRAPSTAIGELRNPWIDLLPFSNLIPLDWAPEREIHSREPWCRSEGIYILVGGAVETGGPTPQRLEGDAQPVLFVKLPGGLRSRTEAYRLLEDARILFIAAPGLTSLGPRAYEDIAAALRDSAGLTREPVTATSQDKQKRGEVGGLIYAGGASPQSAEADVVFVHGLDGDARNTWHPKDDPEGFWPRWMGEDLPRLAVWSFGYQVSASAWKGNAMPLTDRATNALATLEAAGIGDRPIVFICHSLGGLLVKQMLRHGSDYGTAEWERLVAHTRGIVFLSTPHSGSSLANWIKYLGVLLRTTVSVDELEAHHDRLRELNSWYRNNASRLEVRTQVYFEKQKVAGLLVVDESSADPGLPGVVPIPLDEDHISISKPKRTSLLHSRVIKFVEECTK